MTPQDYERQCEQEDDIAAQIRQLSQETGRDIREILQSMRDEGYVECADEAFERVIATASQRQSKDDALDGQ